MIEIASFFFGVVEALLILIVGWMVVRAREQGRKIEFLTKNLDQLIHALLQQGVIQRNQPAGPPKGMPSENKTKKSEVTK